MNRIGVLTTDADLVVTSWDQALAAMTGRAAEAVVGRPLTEIVPDLESRGLLDAVREALETGACRVLAPALHRYLIPCAPASPRAVFEHMRQRVGIGPLVDGGRAIGLAITIEDVTERLEREQQLAAELRREHPAARLRAIEALAGVEPVDGVGPLGDAIGDDDWQVRRAAVRALAGHGVPSVVEALITALRDGHRNFSVLSSALQLLALTGVDLAAALIDLLRHPDPDLRMQAALALGTQRTPEAVDALLAAIDDPDPNVRFHAVESLGMLAPPAAVPRLAALAESGDFFLAFPALESLARINDPSVAPRLVPLLEADLVGDQAAEALGQIGEEDAVPALVRALDRPGSAVASIVDALVAIRNRNQDLPGVGAHIEDLVRHAITPSGARRIIGSASRAAGPSLRNVVIVLGWLRGREVERALTHLLGTAGVQAELVEAIVRFGSPMVDRLVEQLASDDPDTQRAAVVALGRLGDVRAVPALVDLLDGADRDIVVPIISALARLGDGRAFEPLLRLLGHDELAIRQAAIGALNSIGHSSMPGRMRTLIDDPDPRIRESAVKIAGYFGYIECADGLLARCTDRDEAVRAAALQHIPFLDDPRVAPILVAALESDSPRARAAAAQAMSHVTAPEALAALRRAVGDRDPWVRYYSVAALGRRGDVASLPVFEAIATADDHEHVRIAAVAAMSTLGGDQSVELLGALARAGGELGRAALTALGHLRSPAALEPLRAALAADAAVDRAAAAAAAAQWGLEPAIELLQWSAAGDADAAVSRAAIDGLGRIGSGASALAGRAMAALAAIASDGARRADVVAALAHVPVAAIPRVGDCLSARDPRVRHAVVEALGRLSHPDASAYLRGALEDSDAMVRQHAVVMLSRLGSRGLVRSFATMARIDPAETVRRAAGDALSRARDASDRQSEDAPS